MPAKARRSLKTLPHLPPCPFDRKVHSMRKPIERRKSTTRPRPLPSANANVSGPGPSAVARAEPIRPQIAHVSVLFFCPSATVHAQCPLQPATCARQLWTGLPYGESAESFWPRVVTAPFVSFFIAFVS